MRAALQEKEDQRTLKAKMRERARPKLGKIDIDYQKLHDAFFKYALLCLLNDAVCYFRNIGLCCSEVLIS
jgi:Splicing factor 3b, subunit 2